MKYIIHPLTNAKLSLFSNEGINLLKSYIKVYQSGGANSKNDIKIFNKDDIDKILKKKPKYTEAEFNRLFGGNEQKFNEAMTILNTASKIPVASTEIKVNMFKKHTINTNIILGMVKNTEEIRKNDDVPLFAMTTQDSPKELRPFDFIFGKIKGPDGEYVKDTGYATFDAWRERMEKFVARAIMFLKNGTDVFIACQQGKDRSVLFATIVIGVLCKVNRETAFSYIKYYRPFVSTDSFPNQWEYIEEMITKMSKYTDEDLKVLAKMPIPRYTELYEEGDGGDKKSVNSPKEKDGVYTKGAKGLIEDEVNKVMYQLSNSGGKKSVNSLKEDGWVMISEGKKIEEIRKIRKNYSGND